MIRETVCFRSEILVVVLVAAILTIGVVDHGGEWPRTWYVVFLLTQLAIVALVVRHVAFPLKRRIGTFLPAFVLIGLALFGLFQSFPLPIDWVGQLSPSVVDLHTRAGFDLDSIGILTLSVDPSATRASAAMLFTLACVSLVALMMSGIRWAPLCLLGMLVVLGCLISFDGLLRRYTDFPMLYLGNGFREMEAIEGHQFSWFHHRTDAGLMLNISLASALGLLAFPTINRRSNALGVVGERLDNVLRLSFPRVLTIAGIFCISVGILDCGSRGALAGMAAGILACILACLPIRMLPRVILFVVVLGVIGGVSAGSDVIELRSLTRVESTEIGLSSLSSRWGHWLDAWRTFLAFPYVGSGLGTFEVAHLPFQERELEQLASNTHHVLLQACAEAGVFGLIWAAVVVFAIGWISRSLARSTDSVDRSLFVTLCFVFGATVVSESMNCGLMHLPQATSVTLLVSLAWPRALALHPRRSQVAGSERNLSPPRDRITRPFLHHSFVRRMTLVGIVLMIGWSIVRTHHELLRAADGHYLIRTVRDSLCRNQIGARLYESHHDAIDQYLLHFPDDSSVRRLHCLFLSWPLVHNERFKNRLPASTSINWDVDAWPMMPPSALNYQQRAAATVVTTSNANQGIPDSETLLREMSQASQGLLRSSPADPRGFLWRARTAYLAGNMDAMRRDVRGLLHHYHCIAVWKRDLGSMLSQAAQGNVAVGPTEED